MTDHKELVIGGVPVHRRLSRERNRLARVLVERLVTDVATYRRLPPGELAPDIHTVVEANIQAFAAAVRDRRVPDALGRQVGEQAAHGAEEGMPPEAVLTAFHLSFAECWRSLVRDAEPADLPDVIAFTELTMDYLRRVTETVAAAYFEERRRVSREDQDARYRLMSALLSGEPVEGLAASAGLRVPPAYVVMSLRTHPDEDAGESAVAARRKVQRMQRELEHVGEEPVLSLLDGTGGTVLIPGPLASGEAEALAARLSAAGRAEITAAVAEAEPAGVPAAVRQTRDILDVVRGFGHGPGVYRLSDVLLEYQLTRPTAATRELAALLDPLDDFPDLLLTLEAYLRHGRARRATAAGLHVHPNTLDYRLRRVAELTGLSPADDLALQRLAAAMAARKAG
ncbi:helix-turn-helix domain-containing protein [Nonomuraea sp. NPDC005650]|uniref:PucR family transcriptional regulator n=1 Tax=Nonomuraea sp. NPDC005650 TaxID=3157045 RepID=UPI0033B6DC9E